MTRLVSDLDEIFLNIMKDMHLEILNQAESSVGYILNISKNFLDSHAQEAVVEFYKLYFNPQVMSSVSVQINNEIDDLLEKAQNNTLTLDEQDDDPKQTERLSLSALQKKLESIISLDEGIKEELLPVLSSMQFEDLLKHRINHIEYITSQVVSTSDDHGNLQNPSEFADECAKHLTSQAEIELYYKIVLNRQAPAGISTHTDIMDDFILVSAKKH